MLLKIKLPNSIVVGIVLDGKKERNKDGRKEGSREGKKERKVFG